ncbi:MAG: nucleoside phosphorylase [Chloroflexota bacterium]|nr:nucleoside phosphorylase [Chloroflexota bacterium]
MTTLNKADATLGKMQYHLRLKPGDVGKYVLLPGDPDRVFRISKYLDDVKEVVFHREYRTCTGSYKGIKVSATSTGIGCPSAAIAVEELANVGATHFIRVGSTGALQPHINVGDIIINTASMRNEGTTKFYVDDGFPAVADHFLTHALIQAGTELEKKKSLGLHIGLNSSDDAFYGETPEWIELLSRHKLLNVEMESAAIFSIAHIRGLKAAMVCGVAGNLVTADVDYEGENNALVNAWEDAISIALEGIYRYEKQTNQE